MERVDRSQLCLSAKQVTVQLKDGKKFQHDGIRLELVGSIGSSTLSDLWC